MGEQAEQAGGQAGQAGQVGRKWWGPGLALAFFGMIAINVLLIWLAQEQADTIVPSYKQEQR